MHLSVTQVYHIKSLQMAYREQHNQFDDPVNSSETATVQEPADAASPETVTE